MSFVNRYFFQYWPSSEQAARYTERAFRTSTLSKWDFNFLLLYYAYLLLIAVRLLMLTFDPSPEGLTGRYDLLIGSVLAGYVTHHMVGLVLVPLIGTVLIFNYYLIFKPSKAIAVMLTELIGNRKGQNWTTESNSISSFWDLLFQLVEEIAQLLRLEGKYWFRWTLSKVDEQFGRALKKPRFIVSTPFTRYHHLSAATRRRVAIFGRTYELVMNAFVPFGCVIILLFGAGNFASLTLERLIRSYFKNPNNNNSNPLSAVYLFLLEAPVFLLIVHRAMVEIFFIIKAIFVVLLALRLHLAEVNCRVMGVIKQAKSTYNLILAWVNYRYGHAFVLVELIHLNEGLLSPLLFWPLFSHLVLNVYFLCLLTFFRLDWYSVVAALVFITLQFLWAVVIGYLPAFSEQLYRLHRVLYWTQMAVRSIDRSTGNLVVQSTLGQKVKLMAYYELMCTENPVFEFTVGSLAKLNKKWVVEMLLFYSSMIFFSFKILIKQQSN